MADIEAQNLLSSVEVDKMCEAEGLFNTEIGRRIKAADKNGDGRLSTGDFRSLVWSEIEGWKHAKRLRVTLMALSVFLVLVVGANVAMAVGVAELSKEMKVGRNGVMTVKSGKGFVATGQAAKLVDLSEAFNLDTDHLRTIHQLILPADDGSTSIFNVEQINLVPKVSVTFYMAGGAQLTVEEGGMSLSPTASVSGRKLLDTATASGVSTSSNALNPEDGVYGYGGT